MLERIRETSIELWSPVGEFFSSILGTSDTWFPIISYLFISILGLFLLKKFLDKSVESASSLTLSSLGTLLVKLIIFLLILGVVVSLYFYFDSRYDIYQEKKVSQEENFGYLLK